MTDNPSWRNKALGAAEAGTKWMHAVPPESASHWSKLMPSQHRLYNALGMFSFFLMGTWFRDTMRGFDDKGNEIKEEDVLPPFRFLHGLLRHNPHSDDSQDRWRKTMCQMVPAVFGAVGAIVGSIYFFRNNTTFDQRAVELQEKSHNNPLGALEVNDAATHYTSWPMRMAAGIFATFSAASGLTVLYGLFLNSAFSFASNRKMFAGFGSPFNAATGNTYSGFQSPATILSNEVVKALENDAKRWAGEAAKNPNFTPPEAELKKYGERIADGVFGQLFSGLDQEKLRKTGTDLVQKAWEESKQQGKSPEEIAKAASGFMRDLFSEGKDPTTGKISYRGTKPFIETAHKIFGLSKEQLTENFRATHGGFIGKGSEWMLRVFGKDTVLHTLKDSFKREVDNYFKGAGK